MSMCVELYNKITRNEYGVSMERSVWQMKEEQHQNLTTE